jgi:hypothetical protein
MNAISVGYEAVQVEYWSPRSQPELLRGQEHGSTATQEAANDARTGLDQLALVVGSIETLSLPIQSAELLTLARQAIRVMEDRPVSSLNSWADRLAGELSEPND